MMRAHNTSSLPKMEHVNQIKGTTAPNNLSLTHVQFVPNVVKLADSPSCHSTSTPSQHVVHLGRLV